MTAYGSFSFPDHFKPLWERFKKLAEREGKNASILIRDFIAHYVDVHDPGNPQARITSYAEGGPFDVATIEGRIREHFRAMREVRWREIIRRCRQDVPEVSAALAMADRVSKWLTSRGVLVWR